MMKTIHTKQVKLTTTRESLLTNKGILNVELVPSQEGIVLSNEECLTPLIELLYAMYQEQSSAQSNYKEAM